MPNIMHVMGNKGVQKKKIYIYISITPVVISNVSCWPECIGQKGMLGSRKVSL